MRQKGPFLLWCVAAVCCAAEPSSAQDEPAPAPAPARAERRVEVRVTSSSADSVYLDRGAEHGVEVGDVVTLIGATRARLEAQVVALSSTTCRAKMLDGKRVPARGTRGFLILPESRDVGLGAAEGAADEGAGSGAEGATPRRAPEHPEWSAAIPDVDPDAPLLAPAFAMRAHERAATFRGRAHAQVLVDEDRNGDRDATFSLYRAGLDLAATNLFGRGGLVAFEGEWTRRDSEIDGLDDVTEDDFRLDRLFYRWGRGFDSPLVVTVGRFVPADTPELGLIDGVEVSAPLGALGRLTVNGGAFPEPSADRSSFDDMTTTVAWRWREDESEQLVTVLAFQQTWHEGDADRRLVLGRADWSATDDLTLHADAWVDLYDSDDLVKDEGAELTEARGSAVWSVSRDHGLRTSASYTRWPELLRWEFDVRSARTLDRNEVYRADVGGWHRLHEHVRVDERIGYWEDQDDDGVTGDVAVRFPDLLVARNEPAVRVFRIDGANEDGVGVRVSDRHAFELASVALAYETSRHEFDSGGDTRTRHAVLGTLDVYPYDDWSVSAEFDYRFGDDQDAVSLSLYVEYRF